MNIKLTFAHYIKDKLTRILFHFFNLVYLINTYAYGMFVKMQNAEVFICMLAYVTKGIYNLSDITFELHFGSCKNSAFKNNSVLNNIVRHMVYLHSCTSSVCQT